MPRLGAVTASLRQFATPSRCSAATRRARPVVVRPPGRRARRVPGTPRQSAVGQGQREDAKSTHGQALEHAERALPAVHSRLSVGMANVAFLAAEPGDAERAIELSRDGSHSLGGRGPGGRSCGATTAPGQPVAPCRHAAAAAEGERLDHERRQSTRWQSAPLRVLARFRACDWPLLRHHPGQPQAGPSAPRFALPPDICDSH